MKDHFVLKNMSTDAEIPLIASSVTLGRKDDCEIIVDCSEVSRHHRVAWRSVGMLVVLVILKIIEELIVGLVHGKNVGAILAELGGHTWLSVVAPVLLMLLILIPLITATEIDRALGSGGLKQFLLDRRP